jgi:hypothetical protein
METFEKNNKNFMNKLIVGICMCLTLVSGTVITAVALGVGLNSGI